MAVDWKHEALDQLEWHWQTSLRPRLEGLTDEEYLWQPVPDCWTIRPREEATSSHAAGKGALVMDYAWPEPDPAPVTTIAWRLGHLIVGVFGTRVSNHFGDGSLTWDTMEWSATAAGALAQLDDAYGQWMSNMSKLDVDGWAEPVGPAEGPFAEHPYAALVFHLNRETIHHGAEIALLRDLYRAGGGRPLMPTGGATES